MSIATLQLEGGLESSVAGARSLLYRRLSETFAYPTAERWSLLASEELSVEIEALREYLPWAPAFAHVVAPDLGDLQRGYVGTFDVGVGRPYCPLYEGSHRPGRLKIWEDLVRFYEHFGLRTLPGDHPDHICAELDFMHYLSFKEAAGPDHARQDLRRAEYDFLERHLCRWLPRVRARLESGKREVPAQYRALAGFAAEFCEADKEFLKTGGGNPHREVGRRPD